MLKTKIPFAVVLAKGIFLLDWLCQVSVVGHESLNKLNLI